MHWNHRVIKAVDVDGIPYFMLREVYYDADGTPDVHGEPFMHSETLNGLRSLVSQLTEALDQPLLDHTGFPQDGTI